jgi:hypothetical protein
LIYMCFDGVLTILKDKLIFYDLLLLLCQQAKHFYTF